MEKAGEVYNKLKLRFVGKAEVAAKPKIDDKEPEDDVKDTQNTGMLLSSSHVPHIISQHELIHLINMT